MYLPDDRYRVAAFGTRATGTGIAGYRIARRNSRTIVAQYLLPDILEPAGRRHLLKLAKIERRRMNRLEQDYVGR